LSKNSVDSAWCRKELNAILTRELDEKKSILIPCVIDDCEIPLFVREKLYADFRKDKDEAFSDVDRALAKISNPLQGRIETPEFHIDWSTAYGDVDRRDMSPIDKASGTVVKFIEITYVEHSPKFPYIVLSQWAICFRLDPASNKKIFDNDKRRNEFIHEAVRVVVRNLSRWKLSIIIDGAIPIKEFQEITNDSGRIFDVELTCRRLGEDNGMMTLYNVEDNIKRTLEHMDSITRRP
jgi:hypothetical protein